MVCLDCCRGELADCQPGKGQPVRECKCQRLHSRLRRGSAKRYLYGPGDVYNGVKHAERECFLYHRTATAETLPPGQFHFTSVYGDAGTGRPGPAGRDTDQLWPRWFVVSIDCQQLSLACRQPREQYTERGCSTECDCQCLHHRSESWNL